MTRPRLLAAGLLASALAGGAVWSRAGGRSAAPADSPALPDPLDDDRPDAPAPPFAERAAPFLAAHCASCHSGDKPKGGVGLAFADEAAATADRQLWALAAEAVRAGRMPPPGRPAPDAAEAAAFVSWADATSAAGQVPRRVTARRLNRAEYDNTVRDLLGVATTPAADFPADDTGEGFDTLGDVLSVSPTLTEKYLVAAETLVGASSADLALWAGLRTPPAEDFVPYALRGDPPSRGEAAKAGKSQPPDDARAAEIDRCYYALQAFADRAYRRPASHREMYRLMRFVESALERGEPADAGLKLAFTVVLVSPHFLFRLEPGAGPAARPLTGFELATRLSYFLWATTPDGELYRLACTGKLGDPAAVAAQVRRMLADPKSRSLAAQFAPQWLGTRALGGAAPDPASFPAFDAELVRAMRTEPELVFDDVVRSDRSVLDLLTGESTFVNERLARHYGIPGVVGDEFRRVSLAGTGRAGVLTHASVLTVTSSPARTSPVKRGKWVLDNVLAAPTPSPPPGVDRLADDSARGPHATMREQLARHRSRPECAGCHARLDPLGFRLENFDAVGAWRDQDGESAVDATGVLPDGRSFAGPAGLRELLAARPDDFARCLAQKLLTYGAGRTLGPADRPAVERVVRHAARRGYRFADLMVAVVLSDVFRVQPALPEAGAP